MKCIYMSLLILACATSLWAQGLMDSTSLELTSFDDLLDMDMDELMNMEITVASGAKALTQRESPGIVTVITRNQIRNNGWRDLKEILEFIPGFNFAHDIQGVVSSSIRGNWASEGKVLVLIDGMDVNEDMYASVPFGMHFNSDMIERVEIIRGPGSAQYGGAAEMAVVSVITKSASEELNVEVNAHYSRMKKTIGRTGGSILAGTKRENSSFTAFANFEKGERTDRKIADPYGIEQDMSAGNNSDMKVKNGYIKGAIAGFEMNIFYDNYELLYTYPGDEVSSYPTGYESFIGRVKYSASISDVIQLKPSFQYKLNRPWSAPDVYFDDGSRYEDWQVDDETQKYTANIPLSYDISEMFHVLTGMTYEYIQARDFLKWGTFNGANYTEYHNVAGYAQLMSQTSFGTFTSGVRSSYHELAGFSVVPRVAYTNSINDMVDVKLLASGAQRDPVMHNYDYNQDIKPEFTWILESEIGVRPIPSLLLQSNVFWMQIKDAIVYSWDDPSGTNIYLNTSSMGSWGGELSARFISGDIDGHINYSFARNHGTIVENYVDPFNTDRKLAIPEHKITAAITYSIMDQLYVSPSVRYIGERSAVYADWGDYTDPDDENAWIEDYQYRELDPAVILDIVVVWNPLFMKEIELTGAVYNITDDMNEMGQPYYGGDVPLPGGSREISFKIGYTL